MQNPTNLLNIIEYPKCDGEMHIFGGEILQTCGIWNRSAKISGVILKVNS